VLVTKTVLGPQPALAQRLHHDLVNDQRAELLDEIQSQAGPPGVAGMQKPMAGSSPLATSAETASDSRIAYPVDVRPDGDRVGRRDHQLRHSGRCRMSLTCSVIVIP
jgi:hypothetical protein